MASTWVGRGPRRIWREVAVTIGAVLGLACITLAVLAGVFGVKPLVFTSGSMSPEITTGALAFAKETPAADLKVGDVVSVLDAKGVRVTHRVVSATPAFGSTSLVLKGDANSSADVDPYAVTTGDRVVLDIPYGGHAVTWLTSPAGLAAGGVFLGLVLLAAFSPSQRPRHIRVTARRSAIRTVIAVSVLGASTQASIQFAPTQAFWSDTAGATSGTFAAVTSVPTPASSSCVNNGSNVTGTWASTGARYQYQVTANRVDSGAQVGTAQYFTTTSATLNPNSFATAATFQATGQFNFRFQVRSAALNTTTWLSSTTTNIPFRFNKARTSIRCGNSTSTSVQIASLSSDTGSNGSDFITKTAANTLRGTSPAGDSSTVVVKRNGTTIGTVSADDATGDWSLSATPWLSEGIQTFTADATDYLGNIAPQTSQDVRLDTIAPTATQSAPCSSVGNAVAGGSGATWCKVQNLAVSGSFADPNGSGIATSQIDTGVGAGYVAYVDGVTLDETAGQTVKVLATDVAGNTSTASSKTYYVDGTAPVLSFVAPIPGTDYGSTRALRTAVNADGCGPQRVACGALDDSISGLSATAPQWKLQRTVGATTRCLVGGTYGTNCTSTTGVTVVAGGSFVISSNNAATGTIYVSKSGSTDQFYTLTITGIADEAGNVATTAVATYHD